MARGSEIPSAPQGGAGPVEMERDSAEVPGRTKKRGCFVKKRILTAVPQTDAHSKKSNFNRGGDIVEIMKSRNQYSYIS